MKQSASDRTASRLSRHLHILSSQWLRELPISWMYRKLIETSASESVHAGHSHQAGMQKLQESQQENTRLQASIMDKTTHAEQQTMQACPASLHTPNPSLGHSET